MTRAGLVLVQLRYEQKVFWRNIGVAFFTFASPVLLFVLFGALLGTTARQCSPASGASSSTSRLSPPMA
jgi:hypothetical protein